MNANDALVRQFVVQPAFEKCAGPAADLVKGLMRFSAVPAAAGAGAGGLHGGLRELEPEESRLAAILRSALTGTAIGGGIGLGAGGAQAAFSPAGRASLRQLGKTGVPAPPHVEMLEEAFEDPLRAMALGLGVPGGAVGGGALGYQLAKRRPEEDAEEIRP